MKIFANARVEVSLDYHDMSLLMFQKGLELAGKSTLGDHHYLHDYVVGNVQIGNERIDAVIHVSRGYGPYDDESKLISSDEHVVMCFKLAKHFEQMKYTDNQIKSTK